MIILSIIAVIAAAASVQSVGTGIAVSVVIIIIAAVTCLLTVGIGHCFAPLEISPLGSHRGLRLQIGQIAENARSLSIRLNDPF